MLCTQREGAWPELALFVLCPCMHPTYRPFAPFLCSKEGSLASCLGLSRTVYVHVHDHKYGDFRAKLPYAHSMYV
jgi:hypothetical protein